MCRLLAVISRNPLDAASHLDAFAAVCAESREFQGHGWGCAVWRNGIWDRYRTVLPIWEDSFRPAGDVHVLLAHARSAFRDEDIHVENNMPFVSSGRAFLFNGELHGVRLPLAGRTGAQRLFQLIQNMSIQNPSAAVDRAMTVLRRRSASIRACNFILADARHLQVHALFTSDADYFTMHRRQTTDELVICSAPYPGNGQGWSALPNDSVEVFSCSF
jgi:predicted glutamine amidotransferase